MDNKYEEYLPLGNTLVLQGNRKLGVRGCKDAATDTQQQEVISVCNSTVIAGVVADRPKLKQPFEKRKRNYEVVDIANVPIDGNKKVPRYMKAVFARIVKKNNSKKHQDDGKLVSTIRMAKHDKITPFHTKVGINICGNGNMVGKGVMSQMDAEVLNRELFLARAERASKVRRSPAPRPSE